MLVVIALAAILTAIAAVSLAGAGRAARARDVAEAVAQYDRLGRDGARRFGRPATLTFDLHHGTIGRSGVGAADDGAARAADRPAVLQLPGGFRFGRLVWPGGAAEAGEVSLPCSTGGQTPSYALRIDGPRGEQQWLVVAGLTGRTIAVHDAREVDDLFKTLAGGGDGDDAR